MLSITVNLEHDDCADEFEVEYKITSAGSPGRLTGPWEDCYPAEPAEAELCDYTLPEKCSVCGHVFTDEEKASFDAEITRVFEQEDIDKALDDAHSSRDEDRADYEYERMRDEELFND